MFWNRILAKLDPRMSFPLLLIVVFLCLVSVGSIVGAYTFLVKTPGAANAGTLGLAMLIAAALNLTLAYGLFRIKPWARLGQLILSGIIYTKGMILFIFAGQHLPDLADLVIHGLIILYLMSRRCKTIFLSPPSGRDQ